MLRLAAAISVGLLCPVLLLAVDYLVFPSPVMRMFGVPHHALTRWVTDNWPVSQGRAHQIELVFLWLIWAALPAVVIWRRFQRKS